MDEFLNAIAKTLHNLGCESVYVSDDTIIVKGIRFGCYQHRKTFTFCGRLYKHGNVLQATMDLLVRLPELCERRDKALRLHKLNEEVAASGVTIVESGSGYQLRYSSDFDTVASLARQIAGAKEIAFAL